MASANGGLIGTLWLLLLAGSMLVVVWLGMAARREPSRRSLRLSGIGVVLVATTVVAGAWIQAPKVGGYYCTMDAMSTAFSAGATSTSDHKCVDEGRTRVGVGGGVELTILAVGAFLASRRASRSS